MRFYYFGRYLCFTERGLVRRDSKKQGKELRKLVIRFVCSHRSSDNLQTLCCICCFDWCLGKEMETSSDRRASQHGHERRHESCQNKLQLYILNIFQCYKEMVPSKVCISPRNAGDSSPMTWSAPGSLDCIWCLLRSLARFISTLTMARAPVTVGTNFSNTIF